MEFFGNIFTHYNYSTTDINQSIKNNIRTLYSTKSKFNIQIEGSEENEEVQLPDNSPFSDWKTARKFAGPLPFTLSYNEQKGTVLIIQGVRSNWKPKPIKIKSYEIDFINQFNFKGIQLANAFEIRDIPYEWQKGRKEQWK